MKTASVAAGAPNHAPHLCFFRTFFGVIAARIPFGRAVAQESFPIREQLLRLFAIKPLSLRLVKRPFIPIHAQPLQSVDDAFDEFRLVALRIGILDPQNHRSAVLARKQPVEQSRARPSDVEIPCRRRRKTHSNASLGSVIRFSHSQWLPASSAENSSLAEACPTRPTRQRSDTLTLFYD